MNTDEEYDEEELRDDIIQLNIEESCQELFLRSAARWADTFGRQRSNTMLLPADRC